MALLADGTVLSRYTILGKLATGGMAEVYLARQAGPSGFQKLLVLKVILPHLAEDPEFLNMFHNEAKLAALLNHPNVVQIFDFGVDHYDDEEIQYMAMEYIDGLNLKRISTALEDEGSQLPDAIAIRLISDACSALEYAHSLTGPEGNNLEIIHRDVSPENILLTYTGQVKLVDFGIAKARHLESHTSQGALRGKYRFMAPELIRGDRLDCRADIYSLGVTLYRLLLGQLPFEGSNHAQLLDRIVNRDPPAPRELRPDLDEELERVTLKALSKDRDRRYQHAGEMQADLENHLMASGQAVMAYNLSRFMQDTFPPGKDELRERYQRLSGVSSKTPAKARRPSFPTVDDSDSGIKRGLTAPAGTGRHPSIIVPPPDAEGADRVELYKETEPGDDFVQDEDTQPEPDAAPSRPPATDAPVLLAEEVRATVQDFDFPLLPPDDGQATLVADDQLQAELAAALAAREAPQEPEPAEPDEARATQQDAIAPQPTDALEAQVTSPRMPTPRPAQVTDTNEVPLADPEEADTDPGLTALPDAGDELPAQEEGAVEAPDLAGTPAPKRKGGRTGLWIALAVLLLGGAAAAYFLLAGQEQTSATPDAPAATPDAGAKASPDQAAPKKAAPDQKPPPAPDTGGSSAPDAAAPDRSVPDAATPDQAVPDRAAPKKATPDQAAPKKAAPDQKPAAPAPPVGEGSLSVTCALGGHVYLGKKDLGRLPLEAVKIPAGKHRLQIRGSKPRFSVSRTVTVTAGGQQKLAIAPRQGSIKIMVRPWAKVTLDGKVLGTTPMKPVEAYEGRHRLILENSDLKVKQKKSIQVRPGKETVVKVRLGR